MKRKKSLVAVCAVVLMVIIAGRMPVIASGSPVPTPPSYFNSTNLVQQQARPIPTPTPNPKYVYVKGGTAYADFGGLPDFLHYVKLDNDCVVSYPASESEFYYLGHSTTMYKIRSKVIDYITDDTDATDKYKNAVRGLGFTELEEIKSEIFEEFMETIRWGLVLDPDFELDADGIYLAEGYDTFRLLLIGRSVAVNRHGELEGCIELRFYSLSNNDGDMLDLVKVVERVSDLALSGKLMYEFYRTPDLLGDVREISSENVTFLFKPNLTSQGSE